MTSTELDSRQGPRTATQMVESIVGMRDWLRERQASAEEQRRVPQETIERLHEAGIFQLATPHRYGGANFSTRELHDIYRAFGSGCGATAWVVWATAGGNLWSCAFPEDVIAPVYQSPWVGNRTFALGGTNRRVSGTARKVDGGWMITGAWPFATGSVHASHGYLAVYLDEHDDSKLGMALVPKSELVEARDWDAMGLSGTGSQTVKVDGELFVPDERFSTPERLAERIQDLHAEGRGPRRGGISRSLVTCTGIALGMADHAMEIFVDGVGRRGIPYSPYRNQLESHVTHHLVGKAHALIRAASAVADLAVAELDHDDERGIDPDPSRSLQLHMDAAYVWDACSAAIEMLFRSSGASAIIKRQPLQLIARNSRAGSMHGAHQVDTWLENVGRELCGVQAGALATSVLER